MTQRPIEPRTRMLLKRKAKLGLLPPQMCPECRADLSDKDVTEEWANYRMNWSRAVEVVVGENVATWRCPDCGYEWLRHRQ